MYREINVVAGLLEGAEKFILENDRMLFLPFFVEMEKFCNEKGLLFGGKVCNDLLTGRPTGKDSWFWEIYCSDVDNACRELADRLYRVKSNHLPVETVYYSPDIKGVEGTIYVNARAVFKLCRVAEHHGSDFATVVGPAVRKGYFTGLDLLCVPEEVQLISVYRNLYNPAKAADRAQEFAYERELFGGIRQSLEQKIVGNWDGVDNNEMIKKLLINSSNVVVGDYAFKMLGLSGDASRLQIVSGMDPNSVVAKVRALVKDGRNVMFKRFTMPVPSDFRIVKYVVYIGKENKYVAVLDMFNSPEYELVPFRVVGGVKVGSAWVLMRFQFIDLLLLRLIAGNEMGESAKKRISFIIRRSSRLRDEEYAKLEGPENEGGVDGYVGVSSNENVAKKKLISGYWRSRPYYPAKPEFGDN